MELKIIALFTVFIITGAALTLLNRLVELTKYLHYVIYSHDKKGS